MKTIFKLSLISLAICSVCACTDDRDNFMVDDSISYVSKATVAEVSVFSEKYDMSLVKSGKGKTSANVTFAFPDSSLTNYNKANGTSYELLPVSLYQTSDQSVSFSEKDVRKIVELTWKASDVIAKLKTGSYAIPCRLISSGTDVNKDRSLIIICPKLSGIKMKTTDATALNPKADASIIDTLTGEVEIDYPISGKDLKVGLAIDNSMVAAYNTANGTSYTTAPDGLITVIDKDITIKDGQASAQFRYVLNNAKFYNNGAFVDFTDYMVPIKIASTSISGVAVSDNVMYVPVKNESKTLMGPWKVLEGADLCFGHEAGAPSWALQYIVDRMVDGNPATEWISQWSTVITFPMSFVFDLGELHLFKNFKVKDHSTHQGQYRQLEMYMAEKYDGANTKWTLVASGLRGYDWVTGGNTYDFPVQKLAVGRYLKFVIVKPEFVDQEYLNGRGKLAEVYGEGF